MLIIEDNELGLFVDFEQLLRFVVVHELKVLICNVVKEFANLFGCPPITIAFVGLVIRTNTCFGQVVSGLLILVLTLTSYEHVCCKTEAQKAN